MNAAMRVSFEFFPPAEQAIDPTLRHCIARLSGLRPTFVSVTCGADGSTRSRTSRVVEGVLQETGLDVAPHITCVGASRGEILEAARQYWDLGVRRVIALRGDLPAGQSAPPQHPDGFAYASELVAGLRSVANFDISVAAYPEVHPDAASAAADLDNLKRKIDAGASRAITQFFYYPDVFLRFRDKCERAGITAPIVPGILPITRFPQVLRFAERCGATIPGWLRDRFQGLEDDPETRRLIAASVAIEQVQVLVRHGVHDFHFYTLNRAELTYAICHALGVRAVKRTPATVDLREGAMA